MTKNERIKLKEQFKKILEILIFDEHACEVHNDFLCDKEFECEKTNCLECKSRSKTKADLIFENAEEDIRRFYVFGKRDRRKYVIKIITEEDVYSEIALLKAAYIGTIRKEELKYFYKLQALEKYAKEFLAQIAEECFPLIRKEILPIKFHQHLQNWSDYTKEKCTLGNYYRIGNQNIINIYESGSLDIEKLKSNIRHEILHYCLDHSDLINNDDSGVFHALCKIYDGGAYKPMDEEEQKIYDTFFKIYDSWETVKTAYEEKNFTKNNYVQALVVMAGSKNSDIRNQFALWKGHYEAVELNGNARGLKQVSGM